MVATRSPCSRLHVGSILVDYNRHIVGTGYNGPPSGEPECDHTCDCGGNFIGGYCLATCNSKQPCTKSVHSEINSIVHSTVQDLEFCEMFVTHAPCKDCAREVAWQGISKVTYGTEYRKTDGIEYLKYQNIEVVKFQVM